MPFYTVLHCLTKASVQSRTQRQSHSSLRQNSCRFLSRIPTMPWVDVAPDGLSLQLSFPSSSSSLFTKILTKNSQRAPSTTLAISAPWLFHHHPRYIHPTSGQHLRPLVHAHQYKLQHAKIIQRNCSSDTIHYPTPPPPACFHPIGTVYSIDNLSSKSTSLPPLQLKQQENNEWLLQVDWNGPDQLATAFYDIHWLQRCHHRVDDDDDERITHGSSSNKVITNQTQLQTFSFQDVLKQDDILYHLLESLLQYGAILLHDAPNTDTACAQIGKRLSGGNLSHGSLYGDIFHVQSVPNAHNIAYTNDALPVHQDLAYYESPPGFQLLHCRANSVQQGGDSLLLDALAAAQAFAELCPDLFDTLTRVPATFLKQREGADMMYRRAHIRVASSNSLHQQQQRQQNEIISVHWSPPFEGPLLPFSSLSPNDSYDYFIARTAFERMVDKLLSSEERFLPMLDPKLEQELIEYAHTYTWQQQLIPGQILVFSNQRLLHGRTAFSMDKDVSGTRHLTGCYTNVDETLQQYRLLRRRQLLWKLQEQPQQDNEEETLVLPMIGHGSSRIM